MTQGTGGGGGCPSQYIRYTADLHLLDAKLGMLGSKRINPMLLFITAYIVLLAAKRNPFLVYRNDQDVPSTEEWKDLNHKVHKDPTIYNYNGLLYNL